MIVGRMRCTRQQKSHLCSVLVGAVNATQQLVLGISLKIHGYTIKHHKMKLLLFCDEGTMH